MPTQVPVDSVTKSITDLNVPDCPVDSLVSKFVYNFFVANEGVDDSGEPAVEGEAASQLQALISNGTVLKTLPRYVTLEWQPPDRFTSNQTDLFLDENLLYDLEMAAKSNLVNRETDVTIDGRDVIIYQDKDLVKQITTLIDTTALFRLGALPGTNLSQNEVATLLNEQTPPDVDGSLMLELASDPSRFGTTYINEAEGKKIDLNPLRSAGSQRFSFQVDRAVLRDLTDQQSRAPFASDCVFSLLDRDLIETYQTNQVISDSDGIDFEADFEPSIQAAAYSSNITSYSPPTIKIAGYVVEKYELYRDGRRVLRDSMYISDPRVTQTIDTKIKYGSSYAYTVSAICLVSFTQAVVSGGNNPSQAGSNSSTPGFGGRGGVTTMSQVNCLVRSRRSSEKLINCVEEIPPKPPNALMFTYEFDTESLYIEWQNPVERQNDVKKIQIFRRQTIHEPFTIIAQYDFDDSVKKSISSEIVHNNINFKSPGPVSHHRDRGFSRDTLQSSGGLTEAIYAMCSVDAHGMTSNYSTQYHVKYDNMKNKVEVKRISSKGAPKQYPNSFLDPRLDKNISSQRLLEDKMSDSRRYSMRVYFDPEYLRVNDGNGEDLKLLTFESVGTYKFLVLNLDRQRTRMLTFDVEDKRTIGRGITTGGDNYDQ